MNTQSFSQEIIIPASVSEVYEALTNPEIHSEFTGGNAEYTDSLTQDFSIYDGYIKGRNISLTADEKIHQTWQAAEENWPDDYYSEVIYELSQVENGTLIKFTHNNVPEEYVKDISQGWHDHYWGPLVDYFEEEY